MRDSGSGKDSVQDPVDKDLVVSLIKMRARDDIDVDLDRVVNRDEALPVDIFGSEEDVSVDRLTEVPTQSTKQGHGSKPIYYHQT